RSLPSSHEAGTTTVGQAECAGRALETVPSSLPATPPRPRDPTTLRQPVFDSSMSAPPASPISMTASPGTPAALTSAAAALSVFVTAARIELSSIGTYDTSIAAAATLGIV